MGKFRINQIALRNIVWRAPEYPLAAKVLLLDLLWYAGNSNSAFPSQKTLGKNHGLSSRYVRKMLKLLKEYGCITWRKSGFSKSNHYTFSTDLYGVINETINEEQTDEGTK